MAAEHDVYNSFLRQHQARPTEMQKRMMKCKQTFIDFAMVSQIVG